MYSDKTQWGAPARRRTTQASGGDDYDNNSTQRYSTGGTNYYGLDGSESSASGGFTQVPRTSGGHSRSGSTGYHASNAEEAGYGTAGERTPREKVNQIVQAFFWKAAMIIIQSRMTVKFSLAARTQEKKTNKWFSIELDEMDSFRDELKLWRLGDSFDPRPPPLIIETYLDTSDLTGTQTLVILDGDDKRWNVTEALESAANRAGGLGVGLRRGDPKAASQQIVLERWKVELSPPYDLAQTPELPVVYKKSIILFRTLYSYLALMPSWKFRRRLSKLKLHSSALKIGCRVQSGDDFAKSGRRWDGLQVPLLHGDEKATEEFEFGKVESPAGSFSISVEYRSNCDFRVDDSESLLSSHFINLDEHYFHPPSRQRPISQPSTFAGRATEPGSLPLSALPQRPDYAGATYGSLSSFHQAGGLTGASPISTLRAAATEMNRSSSNSSLDHPPSRLQSIQGSKSSLRGSSDIPMSRRGSISFQPFKSPSLSASPANPDGFVGSMGRAGTPSSQPRPSRMGNAGVSPSSHRSSNSTVTPTGEATQSPIPITSSSPKPQPMTRIASSFGSRRPRVSSGASLTREDDNSSGQASYTSSMAAPGSGVYAAAGTSSYEEDLQIRDFMSMLADGQRTSLKSFGGGGASSGESSIRNTGNPLSKFQRMKDSQSALADSMSSSLLLQPSSSTSNSSRNLSGVPGMVTSTTFSSSSSPGKPLSPHTPHTPAIPSRLSEGLTAQYTTDRQRHSRPTASDNRRYSQPGRVAEGTATTSPLDIPLSPRFIGPRRANSNSQQQHEEAIESGESGDFEPVTSFNNRLQSSGDAPLSRSRLQDLHNASQSALPGREAAEAGSRQDDDEDDDGLAFRRVGPPPIDTAEEEPPRLASRFHRGTPSSSYRGRFPRNRADTPTTGSTSSLEKNSQTGSSGSNARTNVGRRTPSWSRPGQGHEDEDLLFAMSDMMVAQQSRRSLDQPEKPGGSDSATSSGRRRSRGGSGAGDSGRGGGGWLVG